MDVGRFSRFFDFKRHLPFDEPAHANEVVDASEGAVPVGVFRFAGEAVAVVDGDFGEVVFGLKKEGGDVAVHAVETDEGVDALALHGFEGATGVADAVVEEAAANGVGELGGVAAGGGVLAIGAVAADKVLARLFEFGDEFGDLGGVVLAVTIHEGDEGLGGVAETGIHGGGLAFVDRKLKGADLRDEGLHDFPSLIRGAVVDGDDFGTGIGGDDFFEDVFGGFFLVIKGDNDGVGQGGSAVELGRG